METNSRYLWNLLYAPGDFISEEDVRETDEIDKDLLESVEGFCSGNKPNFFAIAQWLRDSLRIDTRRELAWDLDACFTRTLLKQILEIVDRAIRLEPVVVGEEPRGSLNVYLREATRAYLFGLFIASVALSRSALEEALEDRVPCLLQNTTSNEKLKHLIRAARTIRPMVLNEETYLVADKVRRSANKVVHGEACTAGKALEILQDARTVLRFMYRAPRRT